MHCNGLHYYSDMRRLASHTKLFLIFIYLHQLMYVDVENLYADLE